MLFFDAGNNASAAIGDSERWGPLLVGLHVFIICWIVVGLGSTFRDSLKDLQDVMHSEETDKPLPPPPRPPAIKYHLFLSHIWSTGQDQCATIKRQLQLVLPGVSIFLDVDDLRSIDDLELYIAQSAVVMIFASKGYFNSPSAPLPALAP